ncbi:hypothetical protein [Polyangium spumosum]|uniref:PLL-like beta propeller domain-containing protein n=1 Tax=Polyangium spumosum TaxID=889282 RepID=A0A6N7PNF4_9BACT|nr:hypothetical protein [Polyangium spumosum]MRG90431.1 hypothetical protein [Polyangium spumosum]
MTRKTRWRANFALALSLASLPVASREARAGAPYENPSGAWIEPATDRYFSDEAGTELVMLVTRWDEMEQGHSVIRVELPDPEDPSVLHALDVRVKQWLDDSTSTWRYEARCTIGGEEKVAEGSHAGGEAPLTLEQISSVAAAAVMKKYDRVVAMAAADSRRWRAMMSEMTRWNQHYPGSVDVPLTCTGNPPHRTATTVCEDPLPTFVDLPDRYSDDRCWDKDSICSENAPIIWAITSPLYGDPFGVCQIPWRSCCLEHDRAFFCGGDCADQNAANQELVDCWASQYAWCGLYTLYAGGTGWAWLGVFWAVFLDRNNADCVSNGDKQGLDDWINTDGADGQDEVDAACSRAKTCFCPDREIGGQWCGGDQPVVLCGNPQCRLNDCSAPEPERYLLGEWDQPGNCTPVPQSEEQCRGECNEEYDTWGNLVSRTWVTRKRIVYSNGEITPWFSASCIPEDPCPDCPQFATLTAYPMDDNVVITIGKPSAGSGSAVNPTGFVLGIGAQGMASARIPHLGGSSTNHCAPVEFHDELVVVPEHESLGGPTDQGFSGFQPGSISAVSYVVGGDVRHELFARDTRDYIYHRRCVGAADTCENWSEWTIMSDAPSGTGIPSVSQWMGSDHQTVLLSVVERRTDERLYRRDFTSTDGGASGVWGKWVELGHHSVGGSPSVVAFRDHENVFHQSVFFRSTSGAIWVGQCDGSAEEDDCAYTFDEVAPEADGAAAHAGDPVAAASRAEDGLWRIDLFILRADDGIQQKTQIGAPSGSWSDWEEPSGSITGAPFVGNPMAIAWRDQFDRSRIQVYARDAVKNLWYRNWDGSHGWAPWTQIAHLAPVP